MLSLNNSVPEEKLTSKIHEIVARIQGIVPSMSGATDDFTTREGWPYISALNQQILLLIGQENTQGAIAYASALLSTPLNGIAIRKPALKKIIRRLISEDETGLLSRAFLFNFLSSVKDPKRFPYYFIINQLNELERKYQGELLKQVNIGKQNILKAKIAFAVKSQQEWQALYDTIDLTALEMSKYSKYLGVFDVEDFHSRLVLSWLTGRNIEKFDAALIQRADNNPRGPGSIQAMCRDLTVIPDCFNAFIENKCASQFFQVISQLDTQQYWKDCEAFKVNFFSEEMSMQAVISPKLEKGHVYTAVVAVAESASSNPGERSLWASFRSTFLRAPVVAVAADAVEASEIVVISPEAQKESQATANPRYK